MKRTFQHRFKGSITATMMVCPDYAPGTTHIISCEWSSRPKPSVLPEFVQWAHTINELIATETGKKILHIFTLPRNRFEAWCMCRTDHHKEWTYHRRARQSHEGDY